MINTRWKHVQGPNTGRGQVGLKSDNFAVASFWITHPNNILKNNVVAGTVVRSAEGLRASKHEIERQITFVKGEDVEVA